MYISGYSIKPLAVIFMALKPERETAGGGCAENRG
jgi:hypothetical protein